LRKGKKLRGGKRNSDARQFSKRGKLQSKKEGATSKYLSGSGRGGKPRSKAAGLQVKLSGKRPTSWKRERAGKKKKGWASAKRRDLPRRPQRNKRHIKKISLYRGGGDSNRKKKKGRGGFGFQRKGKAAEGYKKDGSDEKAQGLVFGKGGQKKKEKKKERVSKRGPGNEGPDGTGGTRRRVPGQHKKGRELRPERGEVKGLTKKKKTDRQAENDGKRTTSFLRFLPKKKERWRKKRVLLRSMSQNKKRGLGTQGGEEAPWQEEGGKS